MVKHIGALARHAITVVSTFGIKNSNCLERSFFCKQILKLHLSGFTLTKNKQDSATCTCNMKYAIEIFPKYISKVLCNPKQLVTAERSVAGTAADKSDLDL